MVVVILFFDPLLTRDTILFDPVAKKNMHIAMCNMDSRDQK